MTGLAGLVLYHSLGANLVENAVATATALDSIVRTERLLVTARTAQVLDFNHSRPVVFHCAALAFLSDCTRQADPKLPRSRQHLQKMLFQGGKRFRRLPEFRGFLLWISSGLYDVPFHSSRPSLCKRKIYLFLRCLASISAESSEMSEFQSSRSEEECHWFDVMRTFMYYGDFLDMEIHRRQTHINALNKFQYSKLPALTFARVGAAQQALQRNQEVFEKIVGFYQETTQDWRDRSGRDIPTKEGPSRNLPDPRDGPTIPMQQQHRCDAVLHSLNREWGVHGAEERKLTFDPLVQELLHRLPVHADGGNAYTQRVLVPGCGLARLPIEIASRGYCVEGNEFSAYMLMASNFVLNRVYKPGELSINPYADKVSNILRTADVVEPVLIPDRPAAQILQSGAFFDSCNDRSNTYPRFSMAAGDFCEIYGPKSAEEVQQGQEEEESKGVPGQISNAETFDSVVTCFFIDTAPVVIDYLATIHHCLRPGGIWINFGPLLYHWMTDNEGNGDSRYGASIELSWDELRLVIESMGFDILTHRDYDNQEGQEGTGNSSSGSSGSSSSNNNKGKKCYIDNGQVQQVQVPYTQCRGSLMWTTYNALFFTCRKR